MISYGKKLSCVPPLIRVVFEAVRAKVAHRRGVHSAKSLCADGRRAEHRMEQSELAIWRFAFGDLLKNTADTPNVTLHEKRMNAHVALNKNK